MLELLIEVFVDNGLKRCSSRWEWKFGGTKVIFQIFGFGVGNCSVGDGHSVAVFVGDTKIEASI